MRIPDSKPRLAVCLLHDRLDRRYLVPHLVPPRVRQPRNAPEDQLAGATVHQGEHDEHVRELQEAEGAVEGDFDVDAGLVYRDNDIRKDLGALHVHHLRANVYEEHTGF